MWTARSPGRTSSFAPTCWARTALLKAARCRVDVATASVRDDVRFHHVSTDEVYGSLDADRDPAFTETTAYCTELTVLGEQGRVRSSGARLSSHLRAAGHDQQLLEQLRAVPVSREADPADAGATLWKASRCRSTGDGENVRDWLYVEDHCRGDRGHPGAGHASARRTTSAAATSGATSTSSGTCCGTILERRFAADAIARQPLSRVPRGVWEGRVDEPDRLCDGPARATTGATPSTPPRSSDELGFKPTEHSRPASRKPWAGT